MDIRGSIKRLGVLDILKETANPIALNRYFTKENQINERGKELLDIMRNLATFCVPSSEHIKAISKIKKRIKDGKGHIGVVKGDFGSGKTAFMAYLWNKLESDGILALPPLGHTHPKEIVEATGKWLNYRLESKFHGDIDRILNNIKDVNVDKSVSAIEDTEDIRKLATISGDILIDLANLCKSCGRQGLIILIDEFEYLTSVSREAESSEDLRRKLEIYREFVRTIVNRQDKSPLTFMISVNRADWDQIVSLKSYSGFTHSFKNEYNVNNQRNIDNPEDLINSSQIWIHWKSLIAKRDKLDIKSIPDPFHNIVFKVIDTVCFHRPGEGQQQLMRGIIRILQELFTHFIEDQNMKLITPQHVLAVLKEVSIEGIQQDGIIEIEEDVSKTFRNEKFKESAIELIRICIPLFWEGVDLNEINSFFKNKDLMELAIRNLEKFNFIVREGINKIRITKEQMDKTVNRLESELTHSKILKLIRKMGYHEFAYPILGLEVILNEVFKNLELTAEKQELEEYKEIATFYKVKGEIEEPAINLYWIEREFNLFICEEKNYSALLKNLNDLLKEDVADFTIICLFRDFDESETILDEAKRILTIKIGVNEECKLEISCLLREAAAIYYYMNVNKIHRERNIVFKNVHLNIWRTVDSENLFQTDRKINSPEELLLSLYRLFYPEYQPVMTKSKNPSNVIIKFIELIKQLQLEYREFGARISKVEFDSIFSNIVTRPAQRTTLENKFQQFNLIGKDADSTGVFIIMSRLNIEKLIIQNINENISIIDEIKEKLKALGYRSKEINLGIDLLVKDREIYEIKKEKITIDGKTQIKDTLKKRRFELSFLFSFINNINVLLSPIIEKNQEQFTKNIKDVSRRYKQSFQNFDETQLMIKEKSIKSEQEHGFILKKYREFIKVSLELINSIGKLIKNSKDGTGLFYDIKNLEKVSISPPDAPFPEYANKLNKIYKGLQKNVEKLAQNSELLKMFEIFSKIFESLAAFFTKLNEMKDLPDESILSDFTKAMKSLLENDQKVDKEFLSNISESINTAFKESQEFQNAKLVIDNFISDYYLFCELLNGKDMKSSYYDLQYSNQIIENKHKINDNLGNDINSLETSLISVKKKINSALSALNDSINELKIDPGLIIQFRPESHKSKDLKDLLDLNELNEILYKFTSKFDELYNKWKSELESLINLSNKYNAVLPNIPILKESDKFNKEFPKLDKLNKDFICIVARSKSIEEQILDLSKKLIESLLDQLIMVINDVLSSHEIFKKIIEISKLRKGDQENIRKSVDSIEQIKTEKDNLLKEISKIEEPDRKVSNLFIRIKKQQDFVKELWQLYQRRLDNEKELLDFKNVLKSIQEENKGPFSLHQYILNFENLDYMSTEEIHELLLNSAEKIIKLTLAGHLQLKFDIIKSEDE